jgi:hypothetical protein
MSHRRPLRIGRRYFCGDILQDRVVDHLLGQQLLKAGVLVLKGLQPAHMISAVTGGMAKVAGSSMAMVAAGPSPGSTPMAVPRKTPMRA